MHRTRGSGKSEWRLYREGMCAEHEGQCQDREKVVGATHESGMMSGLQGKKIWAELALGEQGGTNLA